MGYRTVVWDPDPSSPASRLADQTIAAPFDDQQATEQIGKSADVVTYEFENVDVKAVRRLEERRIVRPGSRILEISQNRKLEKEELRKRGFPTVDYRLASSREEIEVAIRELGYPVVTKTVSTGYDGKGQYVWNSDSDFAHTRHSDFVGDHIVEEFVPLACELSVIAVRGLRGEVVTFPVAQNVHRENILYSTVVPSQVSPETQAEAEKLGRAVIESFDIVGELCVEMFVTNEGKILINELAPRPHNSGHYTLDACNISQFEALIRSICALPLPVPRLLTPCAMVNLLGRDVAHLHVPSILEVDGVKLHLYGKKENRAKRKMGHVTILGSTQEEVAARLQSVEQIIERERASEAYVP